MALRIVTFKVDETFLDLIDSYALRKGISRSQVIRQALVKFFSKKNLEKR